MKFSEVIGQSHAKARLLEAIKNDRLAHSLMLTGPAGVGQMAFANAIAQYVNCLNPGPDDSCGSCHNCIKIRKGIHPDVRFILPIISKVEGGKRYLTEDYFDSFRQPFVADPYVSFEQWQRILGGENKQLFISVHEIRALKRKIFLKAFEAPYKVVIVWRAEQINTEGANAFLKLLEEPPDKTLLILTCSDPGMLLSTINSRCQRIPLQRIGSDEIKQYLIEHKELEEEEATEIAGIAEGSMSNAIEFQSEHSQQLLQTYIEWLRSVYTGHYDKIIEQVEKVYQESKEFQKLFLQLAIKKMRDTLLYHLQKP
ncbi:MAG: hypothetical protein AAF391_11385, partial [Bacteroidota bacterium]